MQKVTLVFQKAFLEYPTMKDVFARDIEVDLPDGFDTVLLASARVYQNEQLVKGLPGGDSNAVILSGKDFNDIIGRILTYVDATFTDQEQRKAHKDIVKKLIWDWNNELRTRAIQTVDAHGTDGNYARTDNFIN